MEKSKSYPLLVENMLYEGVLAGALLGEGGIVYLVVGVGWGRLNVVGG